MIVLSNELVVDLWGGLSSLARATGVSKQRAAYWVRQGFTVAASGRLDNLQGRHIATLPTCDATINYVRGTLSRFSCGEFVTCPAKIAGPYSAFLPLAIGGRLVGDVAPVSVWREALQC